MVGPIDSFNNDPLISKNTHTGKPNSSDINNESHSPRSDSREIGENLALSQAPLSLADDLNKLLSKLELTKTGSFTGTDDALVFKVNYPYLQENGFLKVQNDLLELNKTILSDYGLNERVLNYKIESFPADQFPTRNKIQFKPSHNFQYGSEIVNIPNIYDNLAEQSIFPDYEARLLVPVLVGPPSLADLKTNSGLTNNLVKGISKSALEILEKVANKEGERKVDFHAAYALNPILLPNGKWGVIDDNNLALKYSFDPQTIKISLEPEIVLSGKNTLELAQKLGRPRNQSPITPPVVDDLLDKCKIKIIDGHPIDPNGGYRDNGKRYIATNPTRSLMPSAAIDHQETAGLNNYIQESITRAVLAGSPTLDDLPTIATAQLHSLGLELIFPRVQIKKGTIK